MTRVSDEEDLDQRFPIECPACGHGNAEDAAACNECGEDLA
jgi:hypothetical protein